MDTARSVLTGHQPALECGATTTGIDFTGFQVLGGGIRAEFLHRQVERLIHRVIGGRGPTPRARVSGAIDGGLADGTGPFFYVVTALNSSGLESGSSNEVQAIEPPIGTAPAAPTTLITISIKISP